MSPAKKGDLGRLLNPVREEHKGRKNSLGGRETKQAITSGLGGGNSKKLVHSKIGAIQPERKEKRRPKLTAASPIPKPALEGTQVLQRRDGNLFPGGAPGGGKANAENGFASS